MINPFIVIQQTEIAFNLPRGTLTNTDKNHKINTIRKIAMYLIKQLCHLNNIEIGEYFNRDHTSIYHGIRTIEKILKKGKDGLEITSVSSFLTAMDNIRSKVNNIVLQDISLLWE